MNQKHKKNKIMILELNYDTKTVTVKGNVNLKEFLKTVKKLDIDTSEWNITSEVVEMNQLPYVPYEPYVPFPYYGQPDTGDFLTPPYIVTSNC